MTTVTTKLERTIHWSEADRLAAIIFDKHWGENHPAMRKLLTEALQKTYDDGRRDGHLHGI